MSGDILVTISVDLDYDSPYRLYYSNKPIAISKGLLAGPGLDNILKLFKFFSIKSTFFIPGWIAEKYENMVLNIYSQGHEIAAHGYMHEHLDKLPYEDEYKIHSRSINILKDLIGVKPKGFRAPYWEVSENTFKIIAELGFEYDSSLRSDIKPYYMRRDPLGNMVNLIEFPWDIPQDDWPLYEEYHWTCNEVLNEWINWFDAALSYDLPHFHLIIHPSCSGLPSRVKVLEKFIKYVIKNGNASFLPYHDIITIYPGIITK